MANSESFKGHTDLIEVIILENMDKGTQYRFTISEFRDMTYIGIREWYLAFDGEFAPSTNGVTLPYNLHTTSRLYSALSGVLSEAEVLDEVITEAKEYEAAIREV